VGIENYVDRLEVMEWRKGWKTVGLAGAGRPARTWHEGGSAVLKADGAGLRIGLESRH
jgi:hypothetical protein